MPIRAVFFDFYGTLAYWREPLEATVRKVAARYGLALDWTQFPEARNRLETVWSACQPDSGTMATIERLMTGYRELWRELDAREHLSQLAWEVAQYDHALFSPANAVLYSDALPALRGLRASGLRLGVISNFHTPLHNILESLGVESYFDVVIASHDERVQCEKPGR
ncbi:MAG: HAD family hydrolase, partial [Anaerolineae bacterium]